jgi:guanylate kinase
MITILCGKSASGKDTLLKELVKDGFEPIVSYTSRPMREGEKDGREYHFTDRETFEQMIKDDKLIEYRTYDTLVGNVPDTWYYGMAKQEFDKGKDYVVVLDLDGAENFIGYAGKENCLVCYINAYDSNRTARAMQRGSFDETEWKRRMKADDADFPLVRINEVCDYMIYNNTTLKDCKDKFMECYEEYKGHDERSEGKDAQQVLGEIRDAVKEYYKVIEQINTTYDSVVENLKVSKELLKENEELRLENKQLKEKLAKEELENNDLDERE